MASPRPLRERQLPNVSPLRIAKRESPVRQPQVARRNSSSFKHVRNNNLVSKSPFKSQIPTTSTPRPPFPSPRRISGEKRQRPQSMYDQAEAENDRPFAYKRERRQSKALEGLIQKEPVTKSPFRQLEEPMDRRAPPPPVPPTPSRIPVAAVGGASPTRSSLVSKRMHGPRLSGRRERRKTVTFDERCDSGSRTRQYDSIDLSDASATSMIPDIPTPLELDPDASITGLVDAMFAPNATTATSTPPRTPGADIATDLDTEDGVPFGRTHHAERAAQHHQQQHQHGRPLPAPHPTCTRRFSAARAEQEDVDADVPFLPGSPSPGREALLPRFDLGRTSTPPRARAQEGEDPFALPALKDEPLPEEDSRDVSMGYPRGAVQDEPTTSADASYETADGDVNDNVDASFNAANANANSSFGNASANTSLDRSGLSESQRSGPPRISREEVQRRMMRARSASPVNEIGELEREEDVSMREEEEEEESGMRDEDEREQDRHAHSSAHDEFGLRAPGFGLGLGIEDWGSMRMSSGAGEHMEVDMDMRSALDRLMDDVAGRGSGSGSGSGPGDESMMTEEAGGGGRGGSARRGWWKGDSALMLGGAVVSRSVSVASSSSLLSLPPPPVPPKDNIRSREQMIIEKRREMRRYDEEGYDYMPPEPAVQRNLSVGKGRPSARRSMSTGDAEELARLRGKGLLDVGGGDMLGDSIEKELSKLEGPHKAWMIYASSSDPDRISHMAGAGDVDAGKAWRTVRRPSDMNEYSKQIKEYRAQQNPGKAYGKVFVKVLGVKGMHLPLPNQPTAVTCTLNNGIHFVTTPECELARECRIEQEFELIEHSKLEFTLTLKVRRDPHIISQFKAIAPVPVQAPPPPPPVVQQTSSRGGMRSFFSSSPKKSAKEKAAPAPPARAPAAPQAPQRLPENLARYMKPDGTLARAFISFKDIAPRCDTRVFETNYPLIGQRVELGNKFSTLQVGELVLQMFRLPPLPGIAPDQLPQSLEELYVWRRRQLRVIGANLVAFNDVTKKATATIDLKKAVAVEDDQEARNTMSPASAMTARSRRDEYDGLYGVERSFRLVFPNDQEILFFADTDEEKAKWLEVLRALVGHIPPHPLWGELLWQRQEELSKRAARPGP
ncbi:hypothetical protein C8J57DRAFT_1283412 [Mycena rebaudengoi]|nr:hypothetical protein C8J57DRAFT_1283412 [Mycena rebaudengoi]